MSVSGDRIKFLCAICEVTQQELAEEMGYSSNKTISAYVTGARQISKKTAAKFARAFHVPVEYILGTSDHYELDIDAAAVPDPSALYLLNALQFPPYSVRIVFDCRSIGVPPEDIKAGLHQVQEIDLQKKTARVYHSDSIRDVTIKRVRIITGENEITVLPDWFAYSVKRILSDVSAGLLSMQRDYETFKEVSKT